MDGKLKILIIEDDPFFSKLCAEVLEGRGFTISAAFDGAKGLEDFKEERPDLVVLDLLLPKMHGYEVLKAIRQDPDPELAETPVIILTNLFRSEEKERCQELRANAYLIKASISTDDLLMEIKRILRDEREMPE